MRFDVLTLFPEMVENYFQFSILKRAAASGVVSVNTVNPRDYTENKHKKVDDIPYGGGAGMVLMPQPYVDAYSSVSRLENSVTIMLSPQGEPLTDGIVNELANLGETVYEAFDFSDIESMSFNIKGTIRPEGLRVYVGGAENQVSWPEGALSSIGVLDINEDDWTEVRIEIPDTLTLVNMPLAFANAGDADDWNATYFIIADVTYYDVSGNNVTLKYSN